MTVAPTILTLIWSEKLEKIKNIASEQGYNHIICQTTDEAVSALKSQEIDIVVTALGTDKDNSGWPLLNKAKNTSIFGIMFSWTASQCPKTKLNCYEAGARMVTHDLNALQTVMVMIKNQKRQAGNLQCPTCGIKGMTEDDFH